MLKLESELERVLVKVSLKAWERAQKKELERELIQIEFILRRRLCLWGLVTKTKACTCVLSSINQCSANCRVRIAIVKNPLLYSTQIYCGFKRKLLLFLLVTKNSFCDFLRRVSINCWPSQDYFVAWLNDSPGKVVNIYLSINKVTKLCLQFFTSTLSWFMTQLLWWGKINVHQK